MENAYPYESQPQPRVTYAEPVATTFQQQPLTTNPFTDVTLGPQSSYPVSSYQNSYNNIPILNGFLGSANMLNVRYKKKGTHRNMIITNSDFNNPFFDPQSQAVMTCNPEFQERNWCFCKGTFTDTYMLSMAIVYSTDAERPVPTSMEAQQEGNLIFSFKPHIWLMPTKEVKRFVEIFHDGVERERLGYIEASKDVSDSAQIVNILTKEQFFTRKVESSDATDPQINIVDSGGKVVAWGKLSKEVVPGPGSWPILRSLHHAEFQLFLTPELVPPESSNRAILLVAFIFWIIDAQEKLKRKGLMVLTGAVLVAVVIAALL